MAPFGRVAPVGARGGHIGAGQGGHVGVGQGGRIGVGQGGRIGVGHSGHVDVRQVGRIGVGHSGHVDVRQPWWRDTVAVSGMITSITCTHSSSAPASTARTALILSSTSTGSPSTAVAPP